MADMAPGLTLSDLDFKVLTVFTVGFLVGSNEPAGVTACVLGVGLFWAILTSSDTQAMVNNVVTATEAQLEPLTTRSTWQTYGRPIAYLMFALGITALALA